MFLQVTQQVPIATPIQIGTLIAAIIAAILSGVGVFLLNKKKDFKFKRGEVTGNIYENLYSLMIKKDLLMEAFEHHKMIGLSEALEKNKQTYHKLESPHYADLAQKKLVDANKKNDELVLMTREF